MDVEQLLADLGSTTDATQPLVEGILQVYCKKAVRPYSSSLVDLTMPLVIVYGADASGLFHTIYRASTALVLKTPPYAQGYICDVHRSLLQFHDPELSLHLDRHNLYKGLHKAVFDPESGWHSTAFASILRQGNALSLWDYLVSAGQGDMRRLLLVGIAVVILARTSLLKLSASDDVEVCVIRSLASGVEIAKKSEELRERTPMCTSEDIRLAMFGTAEEVSTAQERIRKHIVIPITCNEVMDSFRVKKVKSSAGTTAPLRYVVLDCRSEKSFNYARLPTAVHIGTKVGYDAELMRAITDRFTSARGSHFCVLGTGRGLTEENNLLNVLALQFVQAGFSQIAIVEEGFKGIIPSIKDGSIEFVQTLTPEQEAAQQMQTPSPPPPPPVVIAKEVIAEKFGAFKLWGSGLVKNISQTLEKAKPVNQLEATTTAPPSGGAQAPAPNQPKMTTQFVLGSTSTVDDEDDDDEFVLIRNVTLPQVSSNTSNPPTSPPQTEDVMSTQTNPRGTPMTPLESNPPASPQALPRTPLTPIDPMQDSAAPTPTLSTQTNPRGTPLTPILSNPSSSPLPLPRTPVDEGVSQQQTFESVAPPTNVEAKKPAPPSVLDDDFDIDSIVVPAGSVPKPMTEDKHPFDDIFV
jgi:hypothetical protein